LHHLSEQASADLKIRVFDALGALAGARKSGAVKSCGPSGLQDLAFGARERLSWCSSKPVPQGPLGRFLYS